MAAATAMPIRTSELKAAEFIKPNNLAIKAQIIQAVYK